MNLSIQKLYSFDLYIREKSDGLCLVYQETCILKLCNLPNSLNCSSRREEGSEVVGTAGGAAGSKPISSSVSGGCTEAKRIKIERVKEPII